MTEPLTLPARLDTPAAGPLAQALLDRLSAKAALHLDGGQVELIGQACLQVLLSARATALGGGLGFAFVGASPAIVEGCALAGLNDLLAA